MAVIIGSARIGESGNATGNAPGDQTGKEVSTQNWYNHSKCWYVLRAKSAEARRRIADCMIAACDNRHIGYDQGQRDSLYNACKGFGFDVSKVSKDVECDCSSLVRVCVCYAGIDAPNFRTATEASVLVKTGAFDKLTDDKHCKSSTNLLRGDILVTRTSGHTVVVLSDGANAAEEAEAPIAPPAPEDQDNQITVVPGTWNIRTAPGTDSPIVDQAHGGDKLTKLVTDWVPIVYDGEVAWISNKAVREV